MKAPLPTTRRTVLAGTGAGLIVAFTAACSGSEEYVAPADGFTDIPADPGASPAPGSDLPGTEPDPVTDLDADVEAESDVPALASLDDIPIGTAKAVKSPDGKQLIISRTAKRKVAAFSAICTHAGCPVKPVGTSLDCPCHGSKFDYATGEATEGPAKKPLAPFAVHLKAGKILPGRKA